MARHRDHLTASCPHFKARNDYKGAHWIQCAVGNKSFRTAWERNQHYRTICCRNGGGCELLEITKRRGPKP